MPFITEEVYHLYFSDKEKLKSIHNSSWPEFDKTLVDEVAEKTGDILVDIVTAVRKYKSDNAMSLKEELNKIVISVNDEDKKVIETVIDDIPTSPRPLLLNFWRTSGGW